nr:MAG TPA: hypothetical protein [Caudoviricetes sp.]
MPLFFTFGGKLYYIPFSICGDGYVLGAKLYICRNK